MIGNGSTRMSVKNLTPLFNLAVAVGIVLSLIRPGFGDEGKVIIFWAPFGGGHKSAAEAIRADILKSDPNANVVLKDVLDFLPAATRKRNLEFYEKQVSKFPEIYDLIFRMNAAVGARIEPYQLPTAYQYDGDAILKYLELEKPSVILSTFHQATESLTRMRYLGILNPEIKIGWQHTDYVDSKVFANLSRRIDMTFLPHSGLKKSWTELYEVPENLVLATGISVNPSLSEPLTPEARSLFLQSKGLKTELRTIVLMSGVNAVGDFPKILRSISEASDEPIQIVAICGKNPDQLAAIQKLSLPSNVLLKAEGFTKPDDVGKYFKSADVIVTKAGGLSSAEIFTIGKPTVLLDINGGQERYNIRYFEKYELATGVRNQKNVGAAILAAVKKGPELAALTERQRAFASEKDVKSPGEWVTEQLVDIRRRYPGGISVALPSHPSRFQKCVEAVKEPFLLNF